MKVLLISVRLVEDNIFSQQVTIPRPEAVMKDSAILHFTFDIDRCPEPTHQTF